MPVRVTGSPSPGSSPHADRVRQGWVAAHSPETAAVGLQILQEGGNAADAAVGMVLAACVAEPLVVSLLSGMHGIHADAAGVVSAVDGFVDVPSVTQGGRSVHTEVVFDDERVPYRIGASTFGVPALVAGCASLNRRHGRLPWPALLEPALRLADVGFVMTGQDQSLLEMLEPVMRLDVGRDVFSRADGSLKGAGDHIALPEIGGMLQQLADEGPQTLYTGDMARELARFCADRGSLVTATDLAHTAGIHHTPPAVVLGRHLVHSRRGLSPLTDYVAGLARRDPDEPTVCRLAAVQQPDLHKVTGTTSLAVRDAEGNACAVTASLGLGTGDWFRGSQLNSMLGETDLQRGPLQPRTRMNSMMAPTVVMDEQGVMAVLGAAGGSRIPSAVLRVIEGMTIGGLSASDAVELPRVHRMGEVVHVEPHLPAHDEVTLRDAGWDVRRWAGRHHFFGGVSVAGRGSACGDPRRGGASLLFSP